MSWFAEMCEEMERTYGERGWKRRLAEMLGVSDSNVQNWIRVGDAPPIVKTAYEAKEAVKVLESELEARERDKFVIEELNDGSGLRVLELCAETGRFVELATAKNLELARSIVQIASGELDQKISLVTDWARDFAEGRPQDEQSIRELNNWQQPTRREQEAETVQMLKTLFEGSSDDV